MAKSYTCIYHANCLDGFASAYVARRWIISEHAPRQDMEFFPAMYGDARPDVTGRHVFILDFSYPRDVLIDMAQHAEEIKIYDHHASAIDNLVDLPSNVHAVFDMERSGCMITHNELFPNRDAPQLLAHIQDRDLWRFALPGTREIIAGLSSQPMDFLTWFRFVEGSSYMLADLQHDGEAILRYKNQCITSLLRTSAQRTIIDEYEVPIINAPPQWASDICHELAKGEPFAASYHIGADEACHVSLRSIEGGVDVRRVAEKYGGGGHAHAAGFRIPAEPMVISK